MIYSWDDFRRSGGFSLFKGCLLLENPLEMELWGFSSHDPQGGLRGTDPCPIFKQLVHQSGQLLPGIQIRG